MKKQFALLAIIFFGVVLFDMGNSLHAQAVKPIELRLSHMVSTMHESHAEILVPFAKQVEERTKGRLKITIYPGEALGKARDHYDMAARGIADICLAVPSYTPGRFPLTGVMDLPMQIPSARVGSLVISELAEKYLKQEYSGVKLLSIFALDPYHINMRKKSVKALEDLKGLRLRSPGPQQTALLRELGASPITIPMVEVYDSLQRGLLDGFLGPFSVLRGYKLVEVITNLTVADVFVATSVLVMNQRAWDSLPNDLQKTLEELTGSRMAEENGKVYDKHAMLGVEDAKKAGTEIYRFPPEQMEILKQRFKPFNEKWVAEMEGKGLAGKRIYEDACLLVEKYSK
jgi:TRAP-type C4-dicarboxylate transport system substrate-binding protein